MEIVSSIHILKMLCSVNWWNENWHFSDRYSILFRLYMNVCLPLRFEYSYVDDFELEPNSNWFWIFNPFCFFAELMLTFFRTVERHQWMDARSLTFSQWQHALTIVHRSTSQNPFLFLTRFQLTNVSCL